MKKAFLGLVTVGLLGLGQSVTQKPGDRYADFSVLYDEFDMERPYAIREADLVRSGKDITSSLYGVRSELSQLLAKGRPSSKFDDAKTKLYVKAGKETWVVDQSGNVRHRQAITRLTDESYEKLRLLVFGRLPVNDPDSIRLPFKRD
jgi:hypothetical protein